MKAQTKTSKNNNRRDMLQRLGFLIGGALAVIGLGLALMGYLPGLLLVLIAIPVAGARRVAELVNIRF